MGRGSRIVVAALAVLLFLAVGLTACGGGDDSGSTAADAGNAGQSQGKADGGSSRGEKSDGKGKSDSGGSGSGSGGSADDFKPRQHDDSGGGSAQFKVKGGDNSVQEFGKEGDQEELDAAASVLHGFLDARAEGNWAAACGYVSKSVIESLEKLVTQTKQIKASDCAGILEKLTNPAAKDVLREEAKRADVGSLRTDGERSFVIYRGTEATILAMPMTNEDGSWKIAGLAATPLN